MIFADSNEAVTSRIPEILKEKGASVVVLPQGFDYIIDDMIAVERKTAADYLQSKASGHLDDQLTEMSYNYEISYLVVYGNMNNELLLRNFPKKAYFASLIGSSLKRTKDGKSGQIITINDSSLYTQEEFADFLMCLDKKVKNKDFIRVPSTKRVHASNDDIRINILQQLPKIGSKRAREILNKYHSLQNLFFTLVYNPELIDIKGLTKETVLEIKKIIEEENNPQWLR